MTAQRSSPAEPEFDFGRVVAFTDGVFAIAITLLVLGLAVPARDTDLDAALRGERTALFAYVLTFVVVGRVWITHHRFVGAVERFDAPLIWLTLLYLAFITLLPFTSELMGTWNGHWEAIAIYAGSIAGVTLAFAAGSIYGYRRGIIRPEYRDYIRNRACPGSLSIGLCFLISIPVAYFYSIDAATVLWIATIFVPDRLGRRIAHPLLGAAGSESSPRS